jgi:hypothetical protein
MQEQLDLASAVASLTIVDMQFNGDGCTVKAGSTWRIIGSIGVLMPKHIVGEKRVAPPMPHHFWYTATSTLQSTTITMVKLSTTF